MVGRIPGLWGNRSHPFWFIVDSTGYNFKRNVTILDNSYIRLTVVDLFEAKCRLTMDVLT
jgi:hypothetical protein